MLPFLHKITCFLTQKYLLSIEYSCLKLYYSYTKEGIFIIKLYNTQKNIASDLANFFQKVTNIKKPQLKLVPYIILGMIESESVVTTDIVKKLKGNFSMSSV